MNTSAKELEFAEAPAVLKQLRESGKTIVQCHGTFDLLHPGHIVHMEEAKALGDILVVTITADRFVNKGPGRPVFNEQLRVRALAALACVDYVIVVPYAAAVEAIECVHPNIYCKGKEYARAEIDVTGNIQNDLKTVERLGGKVCYVGSVVFSSTKVLNRFFAVYPPAARKFFQQVASQYPLADIRKRVAAWPATLASAGPRRSGSPHFLGLDETDLKTALGAEKKGDIISALRNIARRRKARRIILLRNNMAAVGVDRRGKVFCAAPAFQMRQRVSAARREVFMHVARLGTDACLPLAPCLFVALLAASLADAKHAQIDRGRLLKGCEAALNF